MKLILYVFGLLAGSLAVADQHEQYSGIALNQANVLQMNLCSLKPGKTMTNYDRVFNDYIEWSKENDAEVFVLRATPIMGTSFLPLPTAMILPGSRAETASAFSAPSRMR